MRGRGSTFQVFVIASLLCFRQTSTTNRNVLNLSVRPFICYPISEHFGTGDQRDMGMQRSTLGGQEIKD